MSVEGEIAVLGRNGLTAMSLGAHILTSQLLVQREPVAIHLRICFMPNVCWALELLCRVGFGLSLGPRNDVARICVCDFAEANRVWICSSNSIASSVCFHSAAQGI